MSKNLDRNVPEPDISGRKNSFITRNTVFFLCGIGIIGFFVRMYYFPFDIPIIHDSIDYFSYAVVVSQQGHFPLGWELSNNGWPAFLSIFYAISNDGGIWEFIYIQRMLTVIISVLTIIPVYLLCTRFVATKYALIGSTLFIIDPRILANSFLGLTETSFVLLGSLALFLFLSKDIKVVFSSFGVLALFTMIRYEGIFLLIPFLVFFFIRFKYQKKIFLKFLGVVGIFILILLPMTHFRIEATGQDGIISAISLGGADYISKHIIQGIPDEDDKLYGSDGEENRITKFVTTGITSLLKYLGLVMIPIFIFFVPVGFFIFLRSHNDKIKFIIFSMIFLLIPAFYAYGRGIEETRYLYILFPIFCIFSSFTIMKLENKITKKGLFTTLIICGIFIGSIGAYDYQKIDYNHEKESFLIAKDVQKIAGGINHYVPNSKYIHIAEIENNWPVIPLPKENNYDQTYQIKKISPVNFSTLVEYIESSKNKGLTHIVSDGKQNEVEFLNDVFYDEKKFPYLIKEYDSHDKGFQYHVKVFKIDFEKFLELSIKN